MSGTLIGMLHAPPLPGAPHYQGGFDAARKRVLADAHGLVENGIPQLLLENYGDVPFFPAAVPAHVSAYMSVLGAEVKRRFDVPLGINVLRNDACAALAVAHAAGADFVRVNVLCGARVTDQGIVQGVAHELQRLRRLLGAVGIRVYADVDVKHSAALTTMPLEQEVGDLIERGGADALIVTGSGTGKPVEPAVLSQVKQAAGSAPVYVGSGISAENLQKYSEADGFIVGSSLKCDGLATNPVDPQRVQQLVAANRTTA